MLAPLVVAVMIVASVVSTHAACPQTIVDCLGAAAGFKIVADKLTASRGYIGSEGFVSVLGSDVGSACAGTAFVAGPSCDRTTTQSLVLAATDGVAVTFAGFPCPYDGTPAGIGADVVGDVVTGGGRLRNEDAVTVTGLVDTTGADPRVATCEQARADMRSASATLAALPPTRDLGAIRLAPSGGLSTSMTLIADPGVNVWTASLISLSSKRDNFSGEIHSSTLVVALDPATESVVINVRRLKVARYSDLVVSGSAADAAKVVVNLPPGGSVRNRAGVVEPWVLGADGSVSIKTNGESGNGPLGVFAERVDVLGGVVR